MFKRRLTTDNLFGLSQWQFILASDNGNAAGGGSGSPAPNGDASNGAGGANGATTSSGTPNSMATQTTTPDWAQFTAGLDKLGDSLASRLDALRGDVGQLPDHLRPPAPEPPAPDYDTMTQAELANHITTTVMRSFEAKINEVLAPINQQIQTVQQNVTTREVTQEVTQMRGEHKDFSEWKDEMVGLAKQHPTLGIKQLYNLARAENSEKAKALDTKYNPPPPPPAPRWGGLTPSAPGATGSTPPVSRAQAGQDAYREVAARHPGVLAALENM